MTVSEIFDTMDYGPAPESAAEALAWLVDQGDRFGHFIDGAFTKPGEGFDSRNPATGDVLATLTQATQADVDAAVKAARKAQPKWEAMGGAGRAPFITVLPGCCKSTAASLLFWKRSTMANQSGKRGILICLWRSGISTTTQVWRS